MREIQRATLEELAQPISGLRVLLVGFSGAGFPGGDGAEEAVRELPRAGVHAVRTHALDPEFSAKIAENYDVSIVCNTRVGEVLRLPERTWSCAREPVYWFWDLRPGTVAAPLRGKPRHVFLSYCGPWVAPNGTVFHPTQWSESLECKVRYCPQGAPLREPHLNPGGARVVFVGDLKNGTYHRGRAEVCRAVDARVINARARSDRLGVEACMPELYRSSRYCLSMSPLAPGYTSVRTYSILACGGLMAVHRFPEADRLFAHDEHALLFDTVDDLRAQLAELDDDSAERERIALNGRRLHAARHTVAHRVLSICRQVMGVSDDFTGWLR